MSHLVVPWNSQWKLIPGFPNYWISQYGQVFNMKRKALVALYFNQHGIRSVRMYAKLTQAPARGHSRSVRKLVVEVWGAEPAERPLPDWAS